MAPMTLWAAAGMMPGSWGRGGKGRRKGSRESRDPLRSPVREAPYEGTQMEKERNVWPHLLGQTVL